MSELISVQNLSKHFQVYKKTPGLLGSITSLWKRNYERVDAVNNISFSINEGEVVGFIGQNGAGKTTTLKMLSGLLYPSSGSISVLGFTPWDRKPAYQKQFSLVMGQKNQLWWDLPAMETFLLNKAIYEIPDKMFKKNLSALSELLDVSDLTNIQVRKLSLGQRMKCELIAALLHNPKVVFLDEPTIGLDVVMQKTLRDFIRNYNKEFNATIILTSHYMGDVKELCKRTIIIEKGKKVFDGPLKDIIEKYARNKKLTLTFSRPVAKNELRKYGQVLELDEDGIQDTATIIVPRKQSAAISATIMNTLPVQDLTIEEPSIDAIIREVFKSQSKQKVSAEAT